MEDLKNPYPFIGINKTYAYLRTRKLETVYLFIIIQSLGKNR